MKFLLFLTTLLLAFFFSPNPLNGQGVDSTGTMCLKSLVVTLEDSTVVFCDLKNNYYRGKVQRVFLWKNPSWNFDSDAGFFNFSGAILFSVRRDQGVSVLFEGLEKVETLPVPEGISCDFLSTRDFGRLARISNKP